MKVFICAVVTLCLLATGIACYCIHLDSLCGSLLKWAEELEVQILGSNKEGAEKLAFKMQESWEKNVALLTAFTEHSEVNAVTDRLTGIRNSLLYNDFATAYREVSAFKHLLSCILSESLPGITNIL